MRYGIAIFLSIWPLFLIQEFGLSLVVIILINFWIGVGVGEYIEKNRDGS